VFDVIGAVKDCGFTRDMLQRGSAFCNPSFEQWGCKTNWSSQKKEDAIWRRLFIAATSVRVGQEFQEWGVKRSWCWSPRSASHCLYSRDSGAHWTSDMRKLSRYNSWVAMALLTILCTMYTSTTKCVQDGCQDASHQNCRNGVWIPLKNLWGIIKLMGYFSSAHSDCRWKLGPLFPARNKESEQRMATFEFTDK